MREILFRGKRADNGEWIFGGYAKCNNRHYILPDIDLIGKEWVFKNVEVIPETVGQYIGLTDKNGKKIFEGDIFVPYSDDDLIGVVEIRGASFYLRSKYYDDSPLNDYVERTFSHYQPNVGEVFILKNGIAQGEVIGNKWDNPELLEVMR